VQSALDEFEHRPDQPAPQLPAIAWAVEHLIGAFAPASEKSVVADSCIPCLLARTFDPSVATVPLTC
jgi:hypothetical protein